MKRHRIKLGLLALLLAVGTASLAQEPVRKLEFEIGLGPSTVMAKGERYGSISLFTELRGNLQHSHWDVGMQIGTGGQYTQVDYDVEIGGDPRQYRREVVIYILPVADYNWWRGEKVSCFVGGGTGMYISGSNAKTYVGVTIMPRAGVEFFNRLRLTTDYKWNIQGIYNYWDLGIGFVVGGGKKKTIKCK